MEINSEKNLWKFLDEERRNINLPRRFSFGKNETVDSHLSSARTSCASSASLPLWSTSPETPWTRSPTTATTASPSLPLLYHCLASLHRSEGSIFSITVTKDFIFTGSSSTRIHAWKQPDCSETGCIKTPSGQIRAILAHDNLLITTHADYKIRLWDISSSSVENFRPKKTTTLPQRRSFFSYSSKKTLRHKDSISCLAYNSFEKLLYTGSWDHTVKVWRIAEKRCVDSFIAHDGSVNAIVINQEDGCVFTCSSDGTVKIWRRVFRESAHILTMTLKFQPSPVNALALSLTTKGDCFLYSGSSDGLINFWEKEKISGRYNHTGFLSGHHFAVLCLVTVEELILSGSEDSTIRIWKREDSFHTCLAVIDGHHGPVKCLAAAVEETGEVVKGLLVYSASLDQTLKVWRVKVYPSEKGSLGKMADSVYEQDLDLDGGAECRMSPVLSPSWVEKKIQGSDY
ncbi:hypothetical protein ABFS82_04G099700 [Erythranthe guttata]